ncbi:MAG: hypothetical protein ACSHW0_09085 [Thalassotalea sp.]
MKAQYYEVKKDRRSIFEISGVEASIYYGTGLATQSFKAYLGAGIYSEKFKFYHLDDDISGAQITGGLGYNWPKISLELSLNYRSTGDYEDLGNYNDISATSSSLILSYRF